MNRILSWLSLNRSKAPQGILKDCLFKTPHWHPDHQSIYIDGPLAMSATQRFITPECSLGLMPYVHTEEKCVINADVYLTNHDDLCQMLGQDLKTADAVLILLAYLKWGIACLQHLAGQFCFMIWDARHQHFYIAVDPFAQCPLFYIHQAHQYCIIANECSAFHTLYPDLTLNEKNLQASSKDIFSQTKTAYQEILKLPPGHYAMITPKDINTTCYWSWDYPQTIQSLHTRTEYYEAFQEHFERAVRVCTRRIGSLHTQLSGGLDSSSVTAQAALLLNDQHESVYAFTSIPNVLHGPSYRVGWYYHELSKVEDLIEEHHNIQHAVYTANPYTDIFQKLKPLQRCFDQPLRNVHNLDWTMASYEHVLAQQGRILLIGTGGNASISWTGERRFEKLRFYARFLKSKLSHSAPPYPPASHQTMLSGHLTAPLRASVYPLQLWYGVRRLDPTQELNLVIFCANVPSWIYRRGSKPLEQRLLVREGLQHLLPKTIAQNPFRGEQGADWYLHYNVHRQHWYDQLLTFPQKTQDILWQCYDRATMLHLFHQYPFITHPPNQNTTHELGLYLFRCLNLGFYLTHVWGDT